MIVAAVIGILLVTFLAALGRRKSLDTHTGWSIGNRGMSSLTTFFLQAGAIFTSFTFLGMSGLTVLGGVSATYLPAYLILGYIGMFLIGPVVWKLGKVFNYHTNADLVGHQYRSPLLGKLVALVSVVSFVPIVHVQIVGLGTMVSFATGEKSAGNASMIIATILILLFVAYAGLRGGRPPRTSRTSRWSSHCSSCCSASSCTSPATGVETESWPPPGTSSPWTPDPRPTASSGSSPASSSVVSASAA